MARDDSSSDEELLAAFLSGNHDAFAELMRRHEDRVFAVALKLTGDRADALDAAQDAFIAAFRRAGSFRGDAAFGTWLYRIAINSSRDLVRRRRFPPAEHEVTTQVAAVDRTEDPAIARVDVARALAQLPDDYREAVVMHDLGGVAYEEIAALTKSKIGTVKSRISRGRRMLAELLQPRDPTATSKDHI